MQDTYHAVWFTEVLTNGHCSVLWGKEDPGDTWKQWLPGAPWEPSCHVVSSGGTGPLERGLQSHRPPGRPTPQGKQRREHPAEAGSAQLASFCAVWHGRPPQLPDTKSGLCFCLVSGPEFNYMLHGLFSHESLTELLSSSRKCWFDITSGDGEWGGGRGEVRERPSCLHRLLSLQREHWHHNQCHHPTVTVRHQEPDLWQGALHAPVRLILSTAQEVLLLSPFYRWWNKFLEKLSRLANILGLR